MPKVSKTLLRLCSKIHTQSWSKQSSAIRINQAQFITVAQAQSRAFRQIHISPNLSFIILRWKFKKLLLFFFCKFPPQERQESVLGGGEFWTGVGGATSPGEETSTNLVRDTPGQVIRDVVGEVGEETSHPYSRRRPPLPTAASNRKTKVGGNNSLTL